MFVTLLSEVDIIRFPVSGERKICDKNGQEIVTIRKRCGHFLMKSDESVTVLDQCGKDAGTVIVHPGNLYCIYRRKTSEVLHLYAEPEDCDSFERYIVHGNEDIFIGRGRGNTVCIRNRAVSVVHARLSRDGQGWCLYDEDSTNGIYVNYVRIRGKCRLYPGDCIYIMGVRLVIGRGFLAVNHPGNCILDNTSFFSVDKALWWKEKTEAVLPCEKGAKGNNPWGGTENHGNFIELELGDNEQRINLMQNHVAVITGSPKDTLAFVKGLLMQMTARYAPDRLKLIFIWSEEAFHSLGTARWLPHAWTDRKEICLAARNEEDVSILSRYLNESHSSPCHYLFWVFDRKLFQQKGFDKQISGNQYSVLYVEKQEDILPEECRPVIYIGGCKGYISYTGLGETDRNNPFHPVYVEQDIDLWCLELANTTFKEEQMEAFYIVELYIPAAGRSFDVKIPKYRRIAELVPELEREMGKRTNGEICPDGKALLCDGEAGIVLNPAYTPDETGILNGTRLMLI